MRAMSALSAKSTPIMIVETNKTFSAPRLVWAPEDNPSPPKAAPTEASDCCSNTRPISTTDRII